MGKGYKAGGGLTPQFKLADEFQLEGNQRDPEGQEKDRKTSKQSDPSKDNFTGISGSIATIMKQNAAMKKAAKKKKVKEEVVTEKISASGYARAKKWREEQARAKERKSLAGRMMTVMISGTRKVILMVRLVREKRKRRRSTMSTLKKILP